MKQFLTITEKEARELIRESEGFRDLIHVIKDLVLPQDKAEKILEIIEVSFVSIRLKKKIYEFVYPDEKCT